MNQEQIKKWARDAGFGRVVSVHPKTGIRTVETSVPDSFERFANLVAAAEREACAKVCEECGAIVDGLTPKDCAAAIRARGRT